MKGKQTQIRTNHDFVLDGDRGRNLVMSVVYLRRASVPSSVAVFRAEARGERYFVDGVGEVGGYDCARDCLVGLVVDVAMRHGGEVYGK